MVVVVRSEEPHIYPVPNATTLDDVKLHLGHQLSFEDKLASEAVQHPQPYSHRLKCAKDTIGDLRERVEALEKENRERHLLCINWEVRSRLAQALNDSYVQILPTNQYAQIKAAGHGYLPPLLTAYALQTLVPIPALATLSEEELDEYMSKMYLLRSHGLANLVAEVWTRIPMAGRNLMVTLWVTRPSSRASVAHPMPTIQDAFDVMRSEQLLTAQEKQLANSTILVAVDKRNIRLFDDGQLA